MTDKQILTAYKVVNHGKTIYNTYNLLRGEDDWDPMGVKEQIIQAGEEYGEDYTSIPTMLTIQCDHDKIESGELDAHLTYQLFRFGQTEQKNDSDDTVIWSTDKRDEGYVSLTVNEDNSCTVCGKNTCNEGKTVIVYAKMESGLGEACEILVEPKVSEAPEFIKMPEIYALKTGAVKLDYELDLKSRVDQSNITWYRCTELSGNGKWPTAVSTLGHPEKIYKLTPADVGYYLYAVIEPKYSSGRKGTAVTAVTSERVSPADVKENAIHTDFHNFPASYQPFIRPGCWTVDSIKPDDMEGLQWDEKEGDSWAYKTAIDGAMGYGLCPLIQGARLLYTPVSGIYQDMTVFVLADPGKTQGQGFGSAGQYLDIYIKFDTKSLSGYAIRIARTVKSARAVDFTLMQYRKGKTTRISNSVTASSFRTGCRILMTVQDGIFSVHVETSSPELPVHDKERLTSRVNLAAKIDSNPYGGSGVLFTGSTGIYGVGNITMFHQMEIAHNS